MSSLMDLRLDPYPWYAQMLESSPVVFSPEFGAYLVFRAEDVRQVFGDHQTFSSAVFDGLSQDFPFENQLTGMDPPRHTQLRALATHAFTPKAVQELEPRIREIVDRLLAAMLAKDEIDFVRDFAVPFPIAVIAEMLGIPPEDFARFKGWSDTTVEISERLLTGQTEALPEHLTAYNELLGYFRDLLHERRKEPKGDLISRLAAAEVDGRALSDIEASYLCSLLLVAGNETASNLLSNAIRTFAEHPDQWEKLARDPKLASQAVEEVMRYRTSVQLMFRLVKQDTQVGGVSMKAGDRVAVFLGAANRDPAKYDRPNEFDITRPPAPHLTFGHGIHFCLGAPLARLEITTALKALADRVAAFRIPEGSVMEPLTNFNLLGLKRLPLRIEPRGSVRSES